MRSTPCRLQGPLQRRATTPAALTPPAWCSSTSTSPGRSCCARPRASHAIMWWKSRQRSWSCTRATSGATRPAPLTTCHTLIDATRRSISPGVMVTGSGAGRSWGRSPVRGPCPTCNSRPSFTSANTWKATRTASVSGMRFRRMTWRMGKWTGETRSSTLHPEAA